MIEKEKIVEVLEESKDRIMSRRGCSGLCFAISETLIDKGLVTERVRHTYRCETVQEFIPEFVPSFFGVNVTGDYRGLFWWDKSDKEARLAALNKLIELYS